jgi:hypothetical protein
VIGVLAVLVWGLALLAFARDLHLGQPAWGSGSAVVGVGAALLWVLADFPLRYELHPEALVVVTRLRRVRRARGPLRFVGALGKDRFAINGGFGWYGWFRCDGRTARAWVTDNHAVWVMEAPGGLVAFSPVGGEGWKGGLGDGREPVAGGSA